MKRLQQNKFIKGWLHSREKWEILKYNLIQLGIKISAKNKYPNSRSDNPSI